MMDSGMSFTKKIKEELVKIPFEGEHIRAVLSSFAKLSGIITIKNKETNLVLETENAKIAKFIYLLIQKRYGVLPTFSYRRKMKFDKKISFLLQINDKADEILDDLEIDIFDNNPVKSFLKKDDMVRAYFVGAFLATGSCNDPHSSNYHLEISSQEEEIVNYLLKLLLRNKQIRFNAKTIQRRKQFVLYIKKSDQIVNFMAYIGASDSCLAFEEIRVERDFINNDNRLQICVDANYKKTTSSALKQLEDIAIIDRVLGIHNLNNQKMKILCYLRRENEDLSMSELAELLGQELNISVSKSNVNHLFRAIHDLAKRYGGAANED